MSLFSVFLLFLSIFIPQHVRAEPPPPSSVQEVIIREADSQGILYGLPLSVARCESQLDPKAKNPNSSAKGLFQFLDGTWNHYGKLHWGSLDGKSVFNPQDNADLAIWIISKYGTNDWLASKNCWG